MSLPAINPVALSLGPLQIHWYGLMYVFGFFAGWMLGRWRASRPGSGWTVADVDDLVTWAMVGVVVGGRFGYVLFYDLAAFLRDPGELVRIWNGGMSFHGGLAGVLAALWWWGRRHHRHFLTVVDFVAPLVPPGLFFGRLGNFINGELWGAVTTSAVGVIFPTGGPLPRHPSQLYEAALEGLLLFGIVWVYSAKPRAVGRVSGLFGVLYGVFRFAVEFVRQPDAHIGYLAFGWLTMGQVLCVPLVCIGAWLLMRPARVVPVAAKATPAAVAGAGRKKRR